ncbi:MAG: TIGR00730 family Rossman fold protein [Chthoniobacteraceae bacterium]
MKRICVYCGSSPGANPAHREAAENLGALLATRSVGLVYGGGNVGLMGIVADAALRAGGEVIGVIPGALMDKELGHTGVTKLHVTASMHERKQLMADLSDGFVALPGGIGTLEELFETFTWLQLGFHDKPVGLLNVAGFYDHLLTFLRHATAERFMRDAHLESLLVETDAIALLECMTRFRAPSLAKWPAHPPSSQER